MVHREERRFAIQLMEHLVIPAFVLAANGRVIVWNRACEQLTGLPADEILGTSRHWAGFYDQPRPCLADLVLAGASDDCVSNLYTVDRTAEISRVSDERSPLRSLSAENWCVFRGGTEHRYLALDAGPILDDRGAVIAAVETLRDITDQKEAQTLLETLASQDPLTGLANRRQFDAALWREWNTSRLEGGSLALLMLDIDHFKPYNDTYGHLAGDDCLRRLAGLIAQETEGDGFTVARYGGEEFGVVIAGGCRNEAQRLAERIQRRVAEIAIPHGAETCAAFVTVSIGIAERRPEIASPQQLIEAADAALYDAKHNGRDCIAATRRAAAAG